jgi:CRISPR/Cas system-associated exonuclease Cas4 (RecB family)
MKLPAAPEIIPVPSVTPSFYNALLRCRGAAAWGKFGRSHALPSAPAALLGSAFHKVAEMSARGELPQTQEERRFAAYSLFESEAERLLSVSHPFLKRQFLNAKEMPHFYRLQAQAGETALSFAAPFGSSGHAPVHDALPDRVAERKFVSGDGRITGRIDLLDLKNEAIYDYKSGTIPEAMTEAEMRQLRLYAYLCAENGVSVKRAIIVRRDGRKDEIAVTSREANDEASRALDALQAFNALSGAEFVELASPSPLACKFCVCRALCTAFWSKASPEWAEDLGLCAEGKILAVNRSGAGENAILTLKLEITGGTMAPDVVPLPPLPAWAAEADGDEALRVGYIVRVLNLSLIPGRQGTAQVWRVHRENSLV